MFEVFLFSWGSIDIGGGGSLLVMGQNCRWSWIPSRWKDFRRCKSARHHWSNWFLLWQPFSFSQYIFFHERTITISICSFNQVIKNGLHTLNPQKKEKKKDVLLWFNDFPHNINLILDLLSCSANPWTLFPTRYLIGLLRNRVGSLILTQKHKAKSKIPYFIKLLMNDEFCSFS